MVRDDVARQFNEAGVRRIDTAYDPNTYRYGMIRTLSLHAAKELGESIASAWAEDIRALGERGEYFFSLNRYLFLAVNSYPP